YCGVTLRPVVMCRPPPWMVSLLPLASVNVCGTVIPRTVAMEYVAFAGGLLGLGPVLVDESPEHATIPAVVATRPTAATRWTRHEEGRRAEVERRSRERINTSTVCF